MSPVGRAEARPPNNHKARRTCRGSLRSPATCELGVEFLPSLEPFAIKPLQKALPGYQAVAIFHHNRIQ